MENTTGKDQSMQNTNTTTSTSGTTSTPTTGTSGDADSNVVQTGTNVPATNPSGTPQGAWQPVDVQNQPHEPNAPAVTKSELTDGHVLGPVTTPNQPSATPQGEKK